MVDHYRGKDFYLHRKSSIDLHERYGNAQCMIPVSAHGLRLGVWARDQEDGPRGLPRRARHGAVRLRQPGAARAGARAAEQGGRVLSQFPFLKGIDSLLRN